MESILRVRWFGRWLDVKNPLFTPSNYPSFKLAEKVDSGAFRRFTPEDVARENQGILR